ncbi:unnamed protein product [Rotaria sordida]|uniref:Uncharacterized protein n=1 Tax=Rotaria sordida TaxID=392033 RepID=A0A819R0Z6_9BILA|nr:unnamed protein product [Rotaria sordida]
MIGRVATKISNFFHDEHQDTENSQHKRSVNSISPNTPIKAKITTNSIEHNILINTCHSLKKMKIDISEHRSQEKNQQLDQLADVDTDDVHVFQYSELYHASLLSLSSSSVRF